MTERNLFDYAIFTKLMLAGLLAKNAYTEFHEIPSNSSVAGIKRLVDTRDMFRKERLNLSVYWSLSIITSPCVKTNMSVAGQDFEMRCQDVQSVLDDAFWLLVPPKILAGQKFLDLQKKK
jgi:hypothetical protein